MTKERLIELLENKSEYYKELYFSINDFDNTKEYYYYMRAMDILIIELYDGKYDNEFKEN